MSALVKEHSQVQHPTFVAMRDGEIVRLKYCPGCERIKYVSTSSRTSEFPLNGRKKNGSVRGWKPLCKPCYARAAKGKRDAHIEQYRARQRAYYQELRENPEWMGFMKVYAREYRAARRKNEPGFAAKELQRHREWKKRKLQEDPTFFTAARQEERRKKREAEEQLAITSTTQPRICAEPFRKWIQAQYARTGTDSLPMITGLAQRRIWSIMNGEFQRVSLDLVERALLRAPQVYVYGRLIVTISDLYEEEELERVA